MLWGAVGAGKTTLLNALEGANVPARKTQMIDYASWGIDTPGEYAEMSGRRQHLVATSSDARVLVVVHDATQQQTYFPPNYFLMFSKPTIGVVSKIDCPAANCDRAALLLRQSGVKGEIFYVSAITGSGLSQLRQHLLSYSSNQKGVTQHGQHSR